MLRLKLKLLGGSELHLHYPKSTDLKKKKKKLSPEAHPFLEIRRKKIQMIRERKKKIQFHTSIPHPQMNKAPARLRSTHVCIYSNHSTAALAETNPPANFTPREKMAQSANRRKEEK